ncbi:MAG TPA: VOC family protein [Elusimicrobiota bacterium]|nr:VOC family protein [Elusimicrobiota bacterium]
MKPKISIITLGVKSVPKARAFYESLGFPLEFEVEPGADFALFKLEGTRLALFPKDKLAKDAAVPSRGSGFPGFTLGHNVASKKSVDAVIAEAARRGAKVVKKPHDTFWGGYSGYFQDPDGFLWEVAWHPSIDLT